MRAQWFWNGTVAADFRNVGHHAVPFLLDLANATGNATYATAAVRLGLFALQLQMGVGNVGRSNSSLTPPPRVGNASSWYRYGFAGGACDNPNVLDKEAGVLALEAFLALHRAAPGESSCCNRGGGASFLSPC